MSKRGRPSNAMKINVRDAAIGVATRMIAEHGFEATAVQDIASELGITKQALLYHFKTKETLKLAVVDALLADGDRRFREIVSSVSEPAGDSSRLAVVIDLLERYLEEAPDAAPAMLRFVLDRDTGAIHRMEHGVQPWLAFVSEQIRHGQESGLVRQELTAEILLTQVGMLVVAHFAALPLGDWGKKKPKRELNRQRLQQLMETIGWVVFPDASRPPLFGAAR